MRTITHIVYVDPLSPPGRLLLIEAFKVNSIVITITITITTTSPHPLQRLSDPSIGLPQRTRMYVT